MQASVAAPSSLKNTATVVNRDTSRQATFACLVAAAALTIASSQALAQTTLYWDGGTVNIPSNGNGASAGGAGTWNTTILNWDVGVAPHVAWDNTAPLDTAVFGGTAGTVTLGTSISADTININTAGYAISPSATNQLTVSTLNVAGGGTSSFGAAGTLNIGGSLLTVTTATASDRFSFAQEGSTNSTRITLNGGVAATSISGPGYVNFRLVANNTTGGISISGGSTVLLNNVIANSLGTNNLAINGGQVSVYTSQAITRALGTGASQIQITGGVSGFDTTGTVTFNNNAATEVVWGSATFSPSTFVLSASTLANNTDLNGVNRTVQVRSGTTGTMSGRIRTTGGTAGLVKTGAGLLSLTNTTNSYDGGTTVSAGTLAFGAIASMPSTGVVALADNTAIGINLGGTGNWTTGTSGVGTLGGLIGGLGGAGSSTVTYTGSVGLRLNVGADSTYTGVIPNLDTGATTLTKVGNNLLTLTNTNTFTGAVNLQAGTLRLENINSIGSASALNALTSTTLQLRSNTAATFATPLTTLSTTGTASMTIDVNRVSSGSSNQLALNNELFVSNAHGNVTTLNFTGANGYSLSIPTLRLEASSSGGAGGGLTLNPTTTSVAIGAMNYPVSNKNQLLTLGGSSADNSMGTITRTGSLTLNLAKSGTSTWRLTGSNNYAGTNTISGGTLEVAVMANGGSASSLGLSSNAAANVLLGNGTTLRYVGSANATSNRSFTINGTAAGHGATLESSGIGTLAFNTPATALAYGTANQTRTLTLGGTNTGNNTFGKILADNGSGATTLVKSGVGRWVLDQANTFTGGTTVSDGTLLVNNATGSGTGTGIVSIGALATLGGNGTISGATTIDGFHTPGNSPGIQTFGGGLTYNGTSTLTWELIDNTAAALDRGTDYDGVNVTGGAFSLVTGAEIDLAFGGTVDFLNSFWGTDQEWLVVDLSGGATASDTNLFAIGTISGGANYSPTLGTFGIERKPGSNAADSVYLTWVAVPEPSTIALATCGLIGLGVAAHRRFRRKA